jgi:hypothetical protein
MRGDKSNQLQSPMMPVAGLIRYLSAPFDSDSIPLAPINRYFGCSLASTLIGLLIFVLSVALVVGPALFAGRFAARHLGLPGFCSFDVKPKGKLLRELAVFAVATAAPLLVSCSLVALTALVGGQSTSGNRVSLPLPFRLVLDASNADQQALA